MPPITITSSVQVKKNPTISLHFIWTAKKNTFPNAIVFDDLRENKQRGILANFPLDLTTKIHKRGKTLLSQIFLAKIQK